MSSGIDTYLLLRAFAQELGRCGMRAACTSPGSRSAPLVLSLAREPALECYSHIDERCSAFYALGLAKASGLPVAVACTSGTAAAELLPAAIEAQQARVPLLLLSADRPAELRENGAGQAIDQLKLMGAAAKWFFEVDVEGSGEAQLRWMRTLACRAYWTALEGRAGVVHLNFPLREPLVIDAALPGDATARADGAPYVRRPPLLAQDAGAHERLRELLAGARRGVIVAGRHERPPALGAPAAALATAAGWPLLADPLSGARRGDAAVAHYDAILRDSERAAQLAPDLVLRVGDLPVSKPLRAWLAGLSGVAQVALDAEGAWQDPDSCVSHSFALEPSTTLERLAAQWPKAQRGHDDGAAGPHAGPGEAHAGPGGPHAAPEGQGEWLALWRSADQRAAQAIQGVLGADGVSEPAIAAELGVLLGERATLFVASSMPVRDIETFWPVRAAPPRVLCNRGANGIDGTVSSALGAAAAGGGPVVLLIGDVALAHDLGGLLGARRTGASLTIVLIENGGGGIFDFLPVSGNPMALEDEIYAGHILTPTGLDFARAAALYGLAHERVATREGFRGAVERALSLPGSRIIEVRSDRAQNVALHRSVWSAVSDALRA